MRKKGILNRLVQEIPEGLPVTGKWLNKQIDCSRQLIQIYLRNGWLHSPARGVYVRKLSALTWQGCILSLQSVCGLRCHVGGKTSLGLQGSIQYLQLGTKDQVSVWSNQNLPLWLKKLYSLAEFQIHRRKLFSGENTGFVELPVSGFQQTMRCSGRERAFLELLSEVEDESSFKHAYELLEGLTSLRPQLLEQLLEECGNIKVKRLFLFMAERSGHQWFKKLQPDRLELGTGKRMVVRGGRLNTKYGVTVPEEFNV